MLGTVQILSGSDSTPNMQPIEEQPDLTKTLYSTIMLPLVAVLMNAMGMFLNLLTPMDQCAFERRPSLSLRARESKDRSKQFVLVTGCDRGFGYATAKKLDTMGFSVLAGCLDLESENVVKLQSETSARLRTLKLDVTSSEDLQNARDWINNNLEDRSLFGLVNNAGVCFVGTPEIMAHGDMNKIIDVNFSGTVNVTRTFSPFIRKSQGRIINIGSINGDVPMPFFSIYCATKAAIKMFTESLAYEMADWGVKVSLIAPAGFKTGIIMYDRTAVANKWWAEATQETREDYGKDFFNMPMRVSGRVKVGEDLGPVVDSVADALTNNNPKSIYRVGSGSQMLPAVVRFAPAFIRQYLCGTLLNFISGRPQAIAVQRKSS